MPLTGLEIFFEHFGGGIDLGITTIIGSSMHRDPKGVFERTIVNHSMGY